MKAIDLFAGAGGFSTGAVMARCKVVYAANHWPAAVQVHANNHPDTLHVCQDLQQADWREVPAHDILLASPACQGHSRARGKERPHHDAQRSTAWAVVSAVECHRPAFAVIENVVEYAQWTLFPAWCSAMHALGYALAPHIIDAADHGVPQHRRRLFIVASRSKHPMDLHLPKREHVGASSIIDFTAGSWSPIEKLGRSPATLARISAGRADHGDRFMTTTASTMLHELGWRSELIERQLAHAERDKVKAAYNHAEYLAERREMMQAWSDWIDELARKAAERG